MRSSRTASCRDALCWGRSVQDVIHLNLAALDQNRDLLNWSTTGLSYRVHAVSSVQNQQEIIAVQFLEITDILRLQHEQTNSRPCVMLLVIDSYDDLLQIMPEESEKAQVSAGGGTGAGKLYAGDRGHYPQGGKTTCFMW